MASLDFSWDDGPWQRALAGGLQRVRSMGPALREVGDIGTALTKRNIEDGGGPVNWPDLSVSTLINRARHPNGPESGGARQVFKGRRSVGPASSREDRVRGSTGAVSLTKRSRRVVEQARPLIWTRALLRSIRSVVGGDYVDFGSTMVKSWTLFLGSRAGKKPVVPARYPFGRTAADNAAIVGAFVRHILGGIRGRA